MSKYPKKYLCPQCQTNLASKKGLICRGCHNKNVQDKALARAAQREDQKQQYKETKKQQAIKRARRIDSRSKLPKCPSELPPIMKLRFVKIGEDTRGNDIVHEIGRCAYFNSATRLCQNTEQPCPFNGEKDYTALRGKFQKLTRNTEGIGMYPAHGRSKPKVANAHPDSNGQPVSSPPDRGFYHTPIGKLSPLDGGGFMDDIFKAIEG